MHASASEAEQELEGDAADVFIPRITGTHLPCPYHPECTRVFRSSKTRQDHVRVHHGGRVRRERSTAGSMGHSSCGRTDAQRERLRWQRQQARAVLKDIVFENLFGVSLSMHNLLCACLCAGQFIVKGVVEPDDWLLVLCRQGHQGEEGYDYAATAHIFRQVSHLPFRNVVGLAQVMTATRSPGAHATPITFVTGRKFYAFLHPEPYFDAPNGALPWHVTKALIKAVKKECTRLSRKRVLSECGNKVDRDHAAIMLGQIWEQTRAYPQVGKDDGELRAHTWAPAPSMLAHVAAGTT